MELRRPRLELIVALIAAVALAAVLLLAPSGSGTVRLPQRSQPPDLAAPSPGGGVPPPAQVARPAATVLGERVPGFDGTLVAQVGHGRRVEAAQWPSARNEPIATQLPADIALAADAAGRLFAGVAPAAVEGPGQALYVGPASSLRPAAVDVLSAEFHAAAPGVLAWLEVAEEGARLRVGEVDPGGVLTPELSAVAEVAADHRLVAWGDWGFLLAGWGAAEETWVAYLLEPSGTERWRVPAVAAHASPRGDVLLAHDEPGGEFRWTHLAAGAKDALPAPAGWMPAGADLGASWSPDGARIAFVTEAGSGVGSRLHVVGGDGTQIAAANAPLRVAGVSWSHDGRFVLARAAQPESRHAVFFYDTADGSLDEVEFDAHVQLAITRTGRR